ncbi:MAG: nickel pincer cofactor biosynthesis protein LarC [Dehalococcoidia bacterium]|nr:nickel pincer cofactor biosynthesis protein LarC [Dehalococcoidia bacterium]
MTEIIGGPAPRVLVFDCFSGIAGDMTLAALVDAGASLDRVREGLAELSLPQFALATERVMRAGIHASYLKVSLSEERTYQPDEMRAMVRKAGYRERVTKRALAAIDALAQGEADAHETAKPHLHEAGGVDAMIDLVGAMLALEELNVEAAWCPVVTVGSGTITKSVHGALPASPGPAAANILRRAGFAQRFVEAAHELVTPTGAAILAAVATPGPAVIRPELQGAGAGTFNPPERPNALRVFIGEVVSTGEAAREAPKLAGTTVREVVLLEANIDDMPAELLAHARDRLLEAGAFDAWLEPIGMKKGRAATKLCALAPLEEEARFAGIFLSETTTLGVRAQPYRRYEAVRTIETVITSMGPVRVKAREWQGKRRLSPEFEDVRALALAHNLPALEVQRRLEAELTGK